jgi:hypothetical protein
MLSRHNISLNFHFDHSLEAERAAMIHDEFAIEPATVVADSKLTLRYPVTHPDTAEGIVTCGLVNHHGGSIKSRHVGQKHVGINSNRSGSLFKRR